MVDSDAPRRRRYSEEFKRQVVAEAMQPGVSAAHIARRHGLNNNLIFNWKRRFAKEAGFLPVEIKAGPDTIPAASMNLSIEIALMNGTRVAVGNLPDVDTVSQLVRSLTR